MSQNFASSSGGTPATILIVNEAGLVTWFAQYTALMMQQLALPAVPYDYLEIDTEHTFLNVCAPDYYRALISTVRTAYPSMIITLASQIAGFDLNDVSFWDAVDHIGMDIYKPVGTSGGIAGGDTLASVMSAWATIAADAAAMSAAWSGKQVVFTEIGYRSIVGAGLSPGSVSPVGTPFEGDQALCVLAFLNTCWSASWFGGFIWWLWGYPDATVDEAHTYRVADKAAGRVMSTFLQGPNNPPKAYTGTSGTRYRLG